MTARKSRRIPRLTYLIVGIAALSLLGGFAFGAITVGGFGSTPRQATATNVAPLPPTGLTFPLAEAKIVSNTSSPANLSCKAPNLGTQSSPRVLTSGANTTLCLTSQPTTGYNTGDLVYILDIAFAPGADVSTTFQIQAFVSVTPIAHDLVATGYVQTSATISATEGVTLAADITEAGDTSVNGYTVIVTEL